MSTQPSFGAGGFDWLEVWRQMYDAERAQADAVTDPELARHPDHWTYRAGRFAAASRRVPQPDGFMRRLLPRLCPTDTVLDIGAGTGRYVPILGRSVARVIALEPSSAMRAHLEQCVVDEGLHNVDVVTDAWPTDQPPRADIVLSAHVIYSVREVGPFLQAMDAAAQRECYLFLMLRHINTFFSAFWERFHGQPRLPLPCALEALNVLHQLGYPASMELVSDIRPFNYVDIDEALNDIRLRLRFAPDPERDNAIIAAINDLLIRNDDGTLSLPDHDRPSALIWWKSRAARNNNS